MAGDFCGALEELVANGDAFSDALLGQDQDGVDAYLAEFPALADAALASAPPDIAADLEATLGFQEQILAQLEGVPVEDVDLDELFAGADDEALQASGQRVSDYAMETCGITAAGGDDAVDEDLAEPPDPCTLLPDVAAVAAAAGVTVDATDSDGSGSFDVGAFHTRSCSFDDGAATVSTITFADPSPSAARELYLELAEDNGGEEVEVDDLGSLPASTVVTEVDGFVSIAVLASEPAFSLAFPGVTDPALLVAAAEVALEQLG